MVMCCPAFSSQFNPLLGRIVYVFAIFLFVNFVFVSLLSPLIKKLTQAFLMDIHPRSFPLAMISCGILFNMIGTAPKNPRL